MIVEIKMTQVNEEILTLIADIDYMIIEEHKDGIGMIVKTYKNNNIVFAEENIIDYEYKLVTN
jgi:hypothetical protein